ncbi:MAG: hypothetical protein U0746_11395 [Gemmataceae bacterium]
MTISRYVTLVLVAGLVGCGSHSHSHAHGDKAKGKDAKAEAHPTAGPHGGLLVEWGDEEYHVELVFEPKAKQATAYVLDETAAKSKPIAASSLTLELKLEPPVTVKLDAKSEASDPAGQSSRFTGTHDALGTDKPLEGTLSATVGTTPYSGKFKQKAGGSARHHGMPAGVGGTPAEKELFLNPGGIYTVSDIRANGDTVPSVKYRGISWPHEDDLKPGDKVCPVTANKADSRCQWIVNGQNYQFCCTPCLDKFVKWAKESPEKVKEPGAYIQK